MSLVYGNHYKYNDTSFFINVSTLRTMDTLKTPSESFKPPFDTMTVSQYVSKESEVYYIIYLLKTEGCTWQEIEVLKTTLHEISHHLDPVANLRTYNDKEREANRMRDKLLIEYYKLAKALLNFMR